MDIRQKQINSADLGEITLMSPGDILFLYSDGVYDGGDEQARADLEIIFRDNKWRSPKEICNLVLDYAVKQDDDLRRINESDRIDDKTAFIIKHS